MPFRQFTSSHLATTTSRFTRNFKHVTARTRVNGYARSPLLRKPVPYIKTRDRIKHWNVVPGDKVRIVNGPNADKDAVRQVASINKLTNRVYIKGLQGRGAAQSGRNQLKSEHYSNLQLLVGSVESEVHNASGPETTKNVFATRLSTSKPFFLRKHGLWVWNRYAAATSVPLPSSVDAPARKNRIRIPWPEAEQKKKSASAGPYDTLPVDATAVTWVPPHPSRVPTLEHLEQLYIRSLHPTGSFFNPKPRLADAGEDLSHVDADDSFDYNLPMEIFLADELSNPHSRAKKQARWQQRNQSIVALKTELISKELARARRTGPEGDLGGRRVTPSEAKRIGEWKWKQAVDERTAEERRRRWVAAGGQEQTKRRHERSARKVRRQHQRLARLVLPQEPNQVVPPSSMTS